MNVIETTGLGKRYGKPWALHDYTLAVPEGSLAALVGPNGAGESTLMNMAATLGCNAALTAVAWFYLHDHYPVSTFWPMQFFESGWLLALSALLVAGTVRLVRRHAT